MGTRNYGNSASKNPGYGSKRRMARNPHGLSDAHVKFCLAYVKSLNVAVAYQEAYPAANLKVSMQSARNLFKKEAVQDYIDELQHKIIEKKELSLENTLEVIHGILNDDTESSTTRLAAADKLMKYFGGYQRHQEAGASKNIFLGMEQDQLHAATEQMLIAFKGKSLSGELVERATEIDFQEITYEDEEVSDNGKSQQA